MRLLGALNIFIYTIDTNIILLNISMQKFTHCSYEQESFKLIALFIPMFINSLTTYNSYISVFITYNQKQYVAILRY